MTGKAPDVKRDKAENFEPGSRLLSWIEAHPRTGWYIAAVSTLNLLVTISHLFQ